MLTHPPAPRSWQARSGWPLHSWTTASGAALLQSRQLLPHKHKLAALLQSLLLLQPLLVLFNRLLLLPC